MLRLIASFKLLKGLLLLAVGSGALGLLHRPDAVDALKSWAVALHLDPDGRHLGRALEKLGAVDERTLQRISVGTFVYAALLLTEGVGLMLRQRWAEYLTIVITASFIPFEVYEAVQHVTAIRVLAIVINVAIVWYLIAQLKHGRRHDSSSQQQAIDDAEEAAAGDEPG